MFNRSLAAYRFLLPSRAVALLVISNVAALIFGVWWGRFQSALEENKLAIANIDHLPEINPQFREYLKARVYLNVKMFYPANSGYRVQKDWDRGAVNSTILGDVAAAKDPTEPILSWQAAISSQ